MPEFIAGRDAQRFDQSDWDIDAIPVFFNPANKPAFATSEAIEELIKHACASWSLRYSHDLVYSGTTTASVIPHAIVINYQSSAQLAQWYKSEVAGLCKYHTKYHNGTKWILQACEIYVNADNRPFADNFAHGTILHELGHACGIHGHHDTFNHVMSPSSMGRCQLTLADCQMLDNWDPYPVELHKDLSLSIPVVEFGDGQRRWIDLQYTGNQLTHTWRIAREIIWDAPPFANVELGEVVEYQTQMCQRIRMHKVVGKDLAVRADMLFAPNGNLILEYAE